MTRAGCMPRDACAVRRLIVGKRGLHSIKFSTMRTNLHSSRLLIAVVVATAIAASTAMSSTSYASTTFAPPSPSTQSATSATVDSTTGPTGSTDAAAPSAAVPRSYIPVLQNRWPLNTVFGVETGNLASQAAPIANAGPTWVRRNALLWKDIEPTQGARNWSAASAMEADMVAAANNNIRLILIVHGTPSWAQQIPNAFCGAIRADKINAFAAFVRDAVARYSKPPYNVKYWEIWNEPDLGQPGVPPTSPIIQPYGCWGNPNDPYYGGSYFASVLQAVTPQIKAVDPSSRVLVGGLLLDCNPSRPPAGDSCLRGKYLEGILRQGGAPYFDGISFHAYDFFDIEANALGKYSSGNWFSTSSANGPVLIAKVQFIKNLLNQFGVTGKLLMNTEVGLLCYLCSVAPSQFEQSKAIYVAEAYSAAIAEGLAANVWYSYEGWFGTTLNDPTYTAYKTASAKLGDAGYAGAVSASDVGSGGVKGYKFNRGGKAEWVIWSLDGSTKTVTLPGTPAAITDALGASVAAAASLQLTAKPLYIEWP
jgi:hypothetical protein